MSQSTQAPATPRTTQAALLAQHQAGLDADFAAKFPDGKISVRTKLCFSFDRKTGQGMLSATGERLFSIRIFVSRERYRSTSHTKYPAASVCFCLPLAPYGSPENWEAVDSLCDISWDTYAPVQFDPHNNNGQVSLDGFPGSLADKTSTYASDAKCLAALKKRGAGPKALALVQDTLNQTKEQVRVFLKKKHGD